MALITKKNILLTGAGFSFNFGGLLAKEMWSKILSNPQMDAIPQIREVLKNDFDFESVYSAVKRDPRYTANDKKVFQDIVLESYSSMDDSLKRYSQGDYGKFGIYTGNVRQWLGDFAGRSGEVGAHFTLNQDLFIERENKTMPLGFSVPGNRPYFDAIQSGRIDSTTKVSLPNEDQLKEYKEKKLPSIGGYCYIKLHGSIGWLSHDGSSQLILGTNKLEDITKEPLLNWYFNIFEEAISKPGTRLFVIGYSFRDEHINNLILKAIDEHKLEIYIISPEQPENFKDRMEGKKEPGAGYEIAPTIKIWKAIKGYFPYSLKEIFPADQSPTGVFLDIKKNIAKA